MFIFQKILVPHLFSLFFSSSQQQKHPTESLSFLSFFLSLCYILLHTFMSFVVYHPSLMMN